MKSLSLGPSLANTKTLEKISTLASLKKLKLRKCHKLEIVPKFLQLEELKIRKCSNILFKESFVHKNFPLVKKFCFEYTTKLKDEDMEHLYLEFQNQLEHISINHCYEISNKGIKHLSLFNNLHTLKARFLLSINDDLDVFWNKNMKKLDFRYCKKIGNNFCKNFKNNKIEYLDLQSTLITDQGIIELLSNSWETIKTLRLKYCNELSNFSKFIISKNSTNLKHFTITNIIPDTLLNFSLNKFKKLKIYESNFRTEDFQSIIPKLTNLKLLKLYKSNTNFDVMKLISNYCKNLKKLDISDSNFNSKKIIFFFS